MIDNDDIFEVLEAVVALYQRLSPYGKDGDPRLRGASYSADARLSAAVRIVAAAIGQRQPTPDDPDADLIEHDDDVESSA